MIQTERRKYLIEYLLKERNAQAEIPSDEISQKRLLRALFNVRMPKTASGEFKRIQDEYLQEELRLKGVTDIASLAPVATDIYLWKGDISLADKYGLQSLAFCCISTGEFHFPNEKAAEIAVRTVIEYKTHTKSKMKVVFNVFKESDYAIYARILGADK